MGLKLMDLPKRELVGVPRNGRDQPLVVPLLGGKPKALTRTTTFVDCIEDKTSLATWGKRIVLIGSGIKPGLAQAAQELDPHDKDDKRKLNALAEQAFIAGGGKEAADKGTYLHTLSEYVDRGQTIPGEPSEKDVADMAAYKMATLDLEVQRIEQFVVVPQVNCAGTLDRLIYYKGPGPDGTEIEGFFIADLKTGSTEYGGLKMAAQLACYSHGLVYDYTKFPVDVYDPKAFEKWKKQQFTAEEAAAAYSTLSENINQEWGIIISLPAGSGEASLLWADLTVGWEAALLALDIRAMRSRSKKALRPFVGQECASETDQREEDETSE